MVTNSVTRIGILGDGITARAIRSFVSQSGDHIETSIDTAELIVTSPGIPPNQWPETGIQIISDIEFAYRLLKKESPQRCIIGITGTNGKTTVASGVAHALSVNAYGNIGVPLIHALTDASEHNIIVLELSSFQLFSSPTLHCDIAVVLNVAVDHLEWHGSFDAYKSAKKRLIKSENQRLYIPKDIENDMALNHGDIIPIDSLPVPKWEQFIGRHNQLNAAVIQAIATSCGMNNSELDQRMLSYNLPSFRCERVFSNGNITIINDSKATNPSATMAAVRGLTEEVILILCGQPKSDYSHEWMAKILTACHKVYAAGYLHDHQHVFPDGVVDQITFFPTLKDATAAAINNMIQGTILFSPSAASFDEFDDYMARGRAFNEYVQDAF